MLEFSDAPVRLALFSFNGLDYLPHALRHIALAEIRRALRPGG